MNSEKHLAMLNILYSELRSYREKEFNTFIFTFPILGIGLIPNIQKPNLLVIIVLTTLFGMTMIRYFYKNHLRMSKIKSTIYKLQELESINILLTDLSPENWVKKSLEQHLGTMTYISLLVLEIILAWVFYGWFYR